MKSGMRAERNHRPVLAIVAAIFAPIAASFIAAAICVPISSLYLGQPPMGGWAGVPMWVATVASYVAIFALLTSLTAGLAVHSAMHKRGFSRWTHYAIAGAAAGAVASVAMLVLGMISDIGAVPFLGVIAGALTGLFAWLIRRPDRDAPNPATPSP